MAYPPGFARAGLNYPAAALQKDTRTRPWFDSAYSRCVIIVVLTATRWDLNQCTHTRLSWPPFLGFRCAAYLDLCRSFYGKAHPRRVLGSYPYSL